MSARDIQQKILDFIVDYIERVGMSPTQREIAQEMKFASTATADHYLTMLEIRGLILRRPKTSRGIILSEKRPGIPVVGSIAAGMPLDIFSKAEAYIGLDQVLAYDNTYALLVKGRSMIEDHICPEDYVIVKPQFHCQNGDTIVAVHLSHDGAGSATLKRFFREEHRVRLEPANSELSPILIPESEWNREWLVQGKVIAVFRHCVDLWVDPQESVQDVAYGGHDITTEGYPGKEKPVESVDQVSMGGIGELKLLAIARTALEENDQALIGKTYFVQAGISQNKSKGFSSVPFKLPVRSSMEPIEFDILLHASENVELATEWYQRLLYRPDKPDLQTVEFAFRPLVLGHGSLAINFYRERHWLKAIQFEFDAVEQLRTAATSLKR